MGGAAELPHGSSSDAGLAPDGPGIRASGVVSLLSDFGHRDPYVGVMKGVLLGMWPDARLVDLTHEVGAQDVSSANFALLGSWPYFPEGTIHVVVVDPGVGSHRRILCVRSKGHVFIAPDNGVLTGVVEDADLIHAVENEELYRPGTVSNTFHGRDIFAPVAARVGAGLPLSAVGPRVTDPVTLVRIGPTRAEDGSIVGTVVHVDTFGNLITNLREEDIDSAASLKVTFRGVDLGAPVRSYAAVPPGTPLAIMDSFGALEVAINRGSAEHHFNGSIGDCVRIEPA